MRFLFFSGYFILFLPFFKKVKIGKWLELEREVSQAKQELRLSDSLCQIDYFMRVFAFVDLLPEETLLPAPLLNPETG